MSKKAAFNSKNSNFQALNDFNANLQLLILGDLNNLGSLSDLNDLSYL